MTRNWTAAQHRAITARRRVLVAAAAGSGKTSVLTELVSSMLIAREVDPASVCAVTFTEKAAQEMRGRIAARLNDAGETMLAAELDRARIGTIHSLCAAILRTHGTAVGIDPAVRQLDEAQHAWVLRESVQAALDDLAEDADVHWLRARCGDDRVHATIAGIYRLAGQGDGNATLAGGDDPDSDSGAPACLDERGNVIVEPRDVARSWRAQSRIWQRTHREIDGRKAQLGRISFDDLERLAAAAMRIDSVRADIRSRWPVVLIDEFQDTNQRQYELLNAIGGDRLFMVGDEWQSIYRFRGADVDVFRARRRGDDGTDIIQMRENFRSAQPVLDAVNHIFGHDLNFGSGYEPVIAGSPEQRAVAPPAVELLVTPTNDDAWPRDLGDDMPAESRAMEAMRIAERIASLVGEDGVEPGSIAVLYGRGTGVDRYESAIRACGIPVLRDASQGYYDDLVVRDALSVLAAIRNPADDLALASVLSGPLARCSWTELAELLRRSQAAKQPMSVEAASQHAPASCRAALAVLEQLARLDESHSLVELVAAVTRLDAFEVGAAGAHDGRARAANLRRLVELAASAEAVDVRTVAGFLEFVDAQRRDARVGDASIADEHSGAVRLMTIHAAKGLEFEHVFVVEAGARPVTGDAVPAPATAADGRVLVAVPKRDGRFARVNEHAEIHALAAAADEDERRRLWYVAMTRAKSRLYVSGRWNFTPLKSGKPSAMAGALTWLRDVLELGEDLGGAGRRRTVADGRVIVDTSPATRRPHALAHQRDIRERLAPAIISQHERVTDADVSSRGGDVDRHALRQTLRTSIDDARRSAWSQQHGTRIHDAVARLIDAARAGVARADLLDADRGPWLSPRVREQLAPLVGSPVFGRLIELGARAELPYLVGTGVSAASRAAPGAHVARDVADVDVGRIDALAQPTAQEWWVVDWKTALDRDAALAGRRHERQLARYVDVARWAGATVVYVTLASLGEVSVTHTWRIQAGQAFDPDAPPSTTLP